MIERENLKKGDRVLVVGPGERCEMVVVVSVGKKYIGVQRDDDEGPRGVVKGLCGPVRKFNNDDRMEEKDCSDVRLFLGTVEELQNTRFAIRAWKDIDCRPFKPRTEREVAADAWRSMYWKLSSSMPSWPSWKLIGMKAVMDSPTLEEAERRTRELFIHELLK